MKSEAGDPRLLCLRAWIGRWTRPDGVFRRQAAEALKKDLGWPQGMSREGIRIFFDRLKRDANPTASITLSRLGWNEKICWVAVAPGNVPAPLLALVAAGVLSGARLRIKNSSEQRRFAAVVSNSLRGLAGSERVRISSSRRVVARRVAGGDRTIVFGDDRTIHRIGRFRPPGHSVRLVARGERGSAVCINDRNQTDAWVRRQARAAARDIWLYDQRGCLSPRAVLIGSRADLFAGALHGELRRLTRGESWSRPPSIREERAAVWTQITARSIAGKPVKWLGDPRDPASPLVFVSTDIALAAVKPMGQIIGVYPVRDLSQALFCLPFSLAGVAFAGGIPPRLSRRVPKDAWVTKPGGLQSPPTFWNLSHQP